MKIEAIHMPFLFYQQEAKGRSLVSRHDHLRELPIVDYYPEAVWHAINYAATAHETQIRKLSGNHYIEHPFEVLELVRGVTDDVATQQAAVLHDTVEDTWVTFDELREEFGDQAAYIVWGVTKDDSIESGRQCKEAYLLRLAHEAPEGSVIIALADKLHNLSDLIDNYETYGNDMWQHFSSRPDAQLWWFRSVLEIGRARTPDCPLVPALAAQIEVFRTRVLGRSARHITAE